MLLLAEASRALGFLRLEPFWDAVIIHVVQWGSSPCARSSEQARGKAREPGIEKLDISPWSPLLQSECAPHPKCTCGSLVANVIVDEGGR